MNDLVGLRLESAARVSSAMPDGCLRPMGSHARGARHLQYGCYGTWCASISLKDSKPFSRRTIQACRAVYLCRSDCHPDCHPDCRSVCLPVTLTGRPPS